MDEFVTLIEKHKDEFYRYVLRTVWDRSVADDVFASAVLAAYKSKDNFILGTNFRAWMFRILTNKCYVANREIKKYSGNIDDFQEELENTAVNSDSNKILDTPDAFLAECGDEVNMAMRVLSTKERTCFMLRIIEGMSYKEIAKIMEIPFGTVMTHLARGRAKMKNELYTFALEKGLVKKTKKPIKLKKVQPKQRAANE